jgi:aldose sugar dehydrogenase
MRKILGLLAVLLLLTGALGSANAATPPSLRAKAKKAGVPTLVVHQMVGGLDHPWDVRALPGHRLLITQRERRALTVWRSGHQFDVRFDNKRIWVSSETGLMGLEVDPHFAKNRRIYTCQGWTKPAGGHDVRVIAWRLAPHYHRATMVKTLVKGFPTSSGRHGGCRLLIARDGSLLVGTGDAAQGANPESKRSLGGKTLRLNRMTGRPWPTNPFIHAKSKSERYVQTYGHRNVQGLAQRADGTLWSIEQGTYRDDEVNKLVNGGDYGYNPVPGYNESVPMTDKALPGKQVAARWSSGGTTIATSGGTFLPRTGWGALDGTLAVAALKAGEIVFLTFNGRGHLTKVRIPATLKQYGRLRTVVVAPDGDLLIPTDNGGGRDAILRVHPKG